MKENAIHPIQYGYMLMADDMFRLVTQDGLPLWSILEEAIKRGVQYFPWYGYARRRWHDGTQRDTIVAEIKEALSLNKQWLDDEHFVAGELQNLWPQLETL